MRGTRLDQLLRPDRRRQRAMMFEQLVMTIIRRHLPRTRENEDALAKVAEELMFLGHAAGCELVTDMHRENAGLPPRDIYGWTDEELHILENRNLQAMMAPVPPMMPVFKPQKYWTREEAAAVAARQEQPFEPFVVSGGEMADIVIVRHDEEAILEGHTDRGREWVEMQPFPQISFAAIDTVKALAEGAGLTVRIESYERKP